MSCIFIGPKLVPIWQICTSKLSTFSLLTWHVPRSKFSLQYAIRQSLIWPAGWFHARRIIHVVGIAWTSLAAYWIAMSRPEDTEIKLLKVADGFHFYHAILYTNQAQHWLPSLCDKCWLICFTVCIQTQFSDDGRFWASLEGDSVLQDIESHAAECVEILKSGNEVSNAHSLGDESLGARPLKNRKGGSAKRSGVEMYTMEC